MSSGLSRPEALWGFCTECELWRCSDTWFRTGAHRPACPRCGAEPALIETVRDGRATVLLVLDLPPGSELPLLS
ncbi:MAG: hypothetical protein ACREPA_07150 [Candidatus Dormibacteraceae bacterium]